MSDSDNNHKLIFALESQLPLPSSLCLLFGKVQV
jgi:hypothetical protein